MQKTKLGVTVGLMGAGLYFLGLFSFIPAFLLAAYVLLQEENIWLRKTAVKMVSVLIGFFLISLCLDCIDEIFAIINVFIGWGKGDRISVPLNLTNLLGYILWFVRVGTMVILGFKALKQDTIKVGSIDKLVDNNM